MSRVSRSPDRAGDRGGTSSAQARQPGPNGVPNIITFSGENDDTQELNYRCIMKAIADLGFTGHVTYEYSPTTGNDAIKEQAKAMEICIV